MRVTWATDVNGIGNAYGYTHGNRWGRRCLEMAGVQIDPDAPVALHHCPPHAFRPIPGRCNILWTAWEFPELPEWETATLLPGTAQVRGGSGCLQPGCAISERAEDSALHQGRVPISGGAGCPQPACLASKRAGDPFDELTADGALHQGRVPISGGAGCLQPAFPDRQRAEDSALHQEALQQGADAVFVTARFLVPVFKKIVPVPVEYVPQGVDVANFYPAPRPFARRAFRVLWVGAPNDRKGFKFLLAAWRPFQDLPGYELYMKTTGSDRIERSGNITFDSRNLGLDALRELYQSADLFAFPSMGEGFGFTLGEAMACGLPALYTPCTSLLDLADERCAIPLRAAQGRKFRLHSPRGDKEILVEAAEPDVVDLAGKILWAKEHPRRIEKIGRLAAEHVRRHFTWSHAAQALLRALDSLVHHRGTETRRTTGLRISECGLRTSGPPMLLPVFRTPHSAVRN